MKQPSRSLAFSTLLTVLALGFLVSRDTTCGTRRVLQARPCRRINVPVVKHLRRVHANKLHHGAHAGPPTHAAGFIAHRPSPRDKKSLSTVSSPIF